MQQDLQQLKLLSIFYYIWGGPRLFRSSGWRDLVIRCGSRHVVATFLFFGRRANSSLHGTLLYCDGHRSTDPGLDLRDLGDYGRREIQETSRRLCVLSRGLYYHLYYQFPDRHRTRYLRNRHSDAAYRESAV